MGRTYYTDEAVQKYLIRVARRRNVTGILIGQCSPQRDYVALAVQTPEKYDVGEGKSVGSAGLAAVDEEWFGIHVSQVSRMLPGGLLILGVFLVSPPEDLQESLNVLRKLIFATEKISMKNKLWSPTDEDVTERAALHICSSTNKIVCRTFDVKDPKSSARPADWKNQNMSLSWLSVECNVHLHLRVELPSSASYQEQQRCTRAKLAEWAKEIEGCTILFNGKLKDGDDDLLEDPKRFRSAGSSSRPSLSAALLLPSGPASRSTARVQVCKSSLTLEGVVKCRGYVCSGSKPKVRDGAQALRRDILGTVSDRCDVVFQDFLLNGSELECGRTPQPLPRRVFVPLPGATLCDYVVGDETREDVQSRLLEMLDQEVDYNDLDFAEEEISRPAKEEKDHKSHKSSPREQEFIARAEVPQSKFPQSAGIVVAAAAVGLLAILIYLLK